MSLKVSDLWTEFLVQIGDTPICGLCGNTGMIQPHAVLTPNGDIIRVGIKYCICLNGRAMKNGEHD